jgi:predicted nucleic acid-binding protein
MTLMFDTSALVALHVNGSSRAIVRAAMDDDAIWCASALAMTEALAVVDRLSDDDVTRLDLEDALRRTWDYVAVVPVDQRCLDDASLLVRNQPLHVSDAIHLAAATRLPGPIRFVTFDPAQIPVALSLGFDVVSL